MSVDLLCLSVARVGPSVSGFSSYHLSYTVEGLIPAPTQPGGKLKLFSLFLFLIFNFLDF